MRCEEIRGIISLYIDNELNEQDSNEVERHLQICEECNREYEDFLTIKKLLSETPQIQRPEYFKEELHEKLLKAVSDQKTKKVKKKINWRIFSGIAAAVFLLIISVAISHFLFCFLDKSRLLLK